MTTSNGSYSPSESSTFESRDIVQERHLHGRLYDQLLVFAKVWILFCAQNFMPLGILSRHPSTLHPSSSYKLLGVPLYNICHPPQAAQGQPVEPTKALVLGALTHNTCTFACHAMYDRIKELFKDDKDVRSVEWVRRLINRPNFVFFEGEAVYHMRPDKTVHDILILHCVDGYKLVLDLSCWQFGIPKFLYPLGEYERLFVGTATNLGEIIPAEEGKLYESADDGYAFEVEALRSRLRTMTIEQMSQTVGHFTL